MSARWVDSEELRMHTGAVLSALLALTQVSSLAAAQAPTPGAAPTGVADRSTCLAQPSGPIPPGACAEMAAGATLRLPDEDPPGEPAARSGGAAKGALYGLGVGLAVGGLAAALLAGGCEENESRCTVTLIVGGAAVGAGIGAVIGAASEPARDTAPAQVQLVAGAGPFLAGTYFTAPGALEVANGDATAVSVQMSLAVHRSLTVIAATAYARSDWQLARNPLIGSMGITDASLWLADAALRAHLLLGTSRKAPTAFAQAGPGLVYYSISTTVGSELFEEHAANLGVAIGGGIAVPITYRLALEVLAKDYIASMKSVRTFETFGVRGRTAHSLLLLGSVRVRL